MPKPRMKPSTPDHAQHLVIIDVDGAAEEILTASADDAEQLAERVITAAEHLATVRVPVTTGGPGAYTVVGYLVLDLAKARRTAVVVETRQPAMASMGIKK